MIVDIVGPVPWPLVGLAFLGLIVMTIGFLAIASAQRENELRKGFGVGLCVASSVMVAAICAMIVAGMVGGR